MDKGDKFGGHHSGNNHVNNKQPAACSGGSKATNTCVDRNNKYPRRGTAAIFMKMKPFSRQLSDALVNNEVECSICTENILSSPTKDHIWSCRGGCYHIFHFSCIKSWAISSNINNTTTNIASDSDSNTVRDGAISRSRKLWSCPNCRKMHSFKDLHHLKCFCGKRGNNLEGATGRLPYSCGQPCLSTTYRHHDIHAIGDSAHRCSHPCPMVCHPGPCPPCVAQGPLVHCWTGPPLHSFVIHTVCGRPLPKFSCKRPCGKLLSPCGIHKCEEECHPDGCSPCQYYQTRKCLCKKNTIKYKCNQSKDDSTRILSCNQPCGQ